MARHSALSVPVRSVPEAAYDDVMYTIVPVVTAASRAELKTTVRVEAV